MIDTRRHLRTFGYPFPHHTADGLISPHDLARLNAVPPPRDSFVRYVKESPQYSREYRMWLLAVHQQGTDLPAARTLPDAWAQLLAGVVDEGFRGWLSEETAVDLAGHPLDVGIYLRGPGDFQGRATGKTAKKMNFTLYLNEEWSPDGGGEDELWATEDAELPARRIVPRGGSCKTTLQSDRSWHSIAPVLDRSGQSRLTITLEYWKP